MSIEKYLENIEKPDTNPGPFAVRLKYEMKKELFERNRGWSFYPIASTVAASILLVCVGLLIMKPNIADNVHYALSGKNEGLKNIVFVDEGEYLGQKSDSNSDYANVGEFYQVSDLSKLDKSKSYMIKKIRGRRNDVIFYVSEMKPTKKPKVVY